MEIMYFGIFYPKCIYLFKIQKVGMDTEPNKICLVCRKKNYHDISSINTLAFQML